jgi:hypothetical protein
LARTLASPCFGCEPKVRVATKDILNEISQGIKSSQGKFSDFEFTIDNFFKKEKNDQGKHGLNVVYPIFCVFVYNLCVVVVKLIGPTIPIIEV